MKRVWIVPVALLALSGMAYAQSLGEAAEQEKARRKKASGAKAYTNDDIAKASPSPAPSASPGEPAAAAAPSAMKSRQLGAKGETKPAEPVAVPVTSEETGRDTRGEAYWRGEKASREAAVASAEAKVKELEDRVRDLGSDLNPNSPDVMDPDRLRKRDEEARQKVQEIEAAKAAVLAAKQRLADLEDEARRAGAPPGWVR